MGTKNQIQSQRGSNHNQILLDVIFLYFMLILGRGSKLLGSIDPNSNIPGFLIFSLFSVMLAGYVKKSFITKKFLYVTVVVLAWIVVHFFKDSNFQYGTYFSFFAYYCAGYMIARVYGRRIFIRFEHTVFWLSCVSLLFWAIQNIIGEEQLASLTFLEQTWGNKGGSFLVYTVLSGQVDENYFLGICRNCGFAWEPGRFASLLCLAVTCNVIIHKGKFRLTDSHLIVFILCIITTFSTTGYIALLAIYGVNLLMSSRMRFWKKVIAGILFLLICLYVSTLPFITDKIRSTADQQNFVTEQGLGWIEQEGNVCTVDRFEGISLDFLNFVNDPIFGYGLADRDMFIQKNISEYLVTSNGITKPFASMGILLGGAFMILLVLSSMKLSLWYKYPGSCVFVIMLLIVSVSYDFYNNPLMRAIALFVVFDSSNQLRKKHAKRESPLLNSDSMLQ